MSEARKGFVCQQSQHAMLVKTRLISGWNLFERLSTTFQRWNIVSISTKFQLWLIWCWYEVAILTLCRQWNSDIGWNEVQILTKFQCWLICWNEVETLALLDMRLKSWHWNNVSISTKFQPLLIWGWNLDVRTMPGFQPNFNFVWCEIEMLASTAQIISTSEG